VAKIGLHLDRTIKGYPKTPPFHPHKKYPEYLFNEELSKHNSVYDAVRNRFRLLELDGQRYGTADWNPFGAFVAPGSTVVIKPNFVFHSKEPQDQRRVDCTITNGSVLRAVLDFTIIALKDSGEIIIADSPIEAADFDAIKSYTGLEVITDFLKHRSNVRISFLDLRIRRALKDKGGKVIGHTNLSGGPQGTIDIDMQNSSYLAELDESCPNYLTVADWRVNHEDPRDITKGLTNVYHNARCHRYKVSKVFLQADTVISISKLKTHKKAGVTLSLKNFVGICSDKEYMPHHRGGPPPTGDSFPRYPKKIELGINSFLNKLKYISPVRRFISKYLKPLVYTFASPETLLPIQNGSWSGNDTLWRTILDLNTIVRRADSEGRILGVVKRKFFFIVDGIIAGEGDGPLQNIAKPLGLVAASESSAALDWHLARLMGFDPERIPHVREAVKAENKLLDTGQDQQAEILSNVQECQSINFKFRPATGWKDTMR